jgi:hypothetical protein
VRAAAVQAALVNVADKEVGAALVATFADLAQQLLDRDAGLFGPALAEVAAVGVDKGGRYFGTRCSRSGSLARSQRLTVLSERFRRRAHSSRPTFRARSSWTCC